MTTLFLLLTLSCSVSLSAQIALAEEWLQLDYRNEIGLDLSDEEWQAIQEIQSGFADIPRMRPPLEELLADERDQYVEILESFFTAIADEMAAEQQAYFDAYWRETQRPYLPESMEADYPGIGISYNQSKLLSEALQEEDRALIESLSAERLSGILFPGQISLYQVHESMQEKELQAHQLKKRLERQKQERNAIVEVFQTMVLQYLSPLREQRTRFEQELSVEDRRQLDSLRKQRRMITAPVIQTMRDNAGSVAELALMVDPFSYSLHHFPRDIGEDLPTYSLGENLVDPAAIADITERNRSLVQTYEEELLAITQQCRAAFAELGDFHGINDASHELEQQFFFPNDTLSNAFIEVFLLMEPFNFDDPEAGYPSPFLINGLPQAVAADRASVSIVLHAARDIQLEIYNESNGELVKTIVDHTYTPGEYQFEVDISDLPEGEYSYVLTTNNGGRYLWPLVVERR